MPERLLIGWLAHSAPPLFTQLERTGYRAALTSHPAVVCLPSWVGEYSVAQGTQRRQSRSLGGQQIHIEGAHVLQLALRLHPCLILLLLLKILLQLRLRLRAAAWLRA